MTETNSGNPQKSGFSTQQINYTKRRVFNQNNNINKNKFNKNNNSEINTKNLNKNNVENKKNNNFKFKNNYKNNFNNKKINNNQNNNLNNVFIKKINNGKFNSNEPKVKITFLGGVGEIGKNMTVFETQKDIFVLDSGLAFPGNEFPGVEIIVPDISYLLANKSKIRGIVITHGHEDHIGALPFVLKDLKVPVYASRFTLALIEKKMREFPKVKYTPIEVKPSNQLNLGDFKLNFIHVNHSVVGALAVAINSPAGLIMHTGDFKIDPSPVDHKTTDLASFEKYGKQGVNLLLCESTNVGIKGHSISETNVGKVLEEEVFLKHKDQRLIVSTFASNVHRLQQILSLSEKYGRKIAFTGRSMLNVSEVAMKLGELKYNKENVIDIESTKKLADSEVIVISTGSQGEELSALTRMANDEFPKLKLTANDCVVFSSSPIPGNEKGIINVINKLVHKNVEVIDDSLAAVHASGHGCRDEISQIHMLTKPKFLIPVHGEYLHFKQHKELALAEGFAERQILMVDLGWQVELTPTALRHTGIVKAGYKLVDGSGLGDLQSPVIKDRKQLLNDGFIVVLLNISLNTFSLINDPLIITRGLLYNNEIEMITNELKTGLSVFIKNYDLKGVDSNALKNELKKYVSNIIFRKTKRRPIAIVATNFNS